MATVARTHPKDSTYRRAMERRLRFAAAAIRQVRCAMCERPARAITCERPDCWAQMQTLPLAHQAYLLDCYDDRADRRRWTWGRALETAAMGSLLIAGFAAVLWPITRLVMGG